MKKVPMRKCVATNEQLPKKELLRIVRRPNGEVVVDVTGKENGRGAYLKKSLDALEEAKKKNVLAKALETSVSDEVYESIRQVISGK